MQQNDISSDILKLPPPFLFEPLRRNHNTKSFSCGEEDLDLYVKRFAFTNHQKGFSKTYVAVHKGEKQVQGYYCISTDCVSLDLMPEPAGMPSKIPLVLIGRLAVDLSNQQRGLGTDLLLHAFFQNVLTIADVVGIYAVTVVALNEQVSRWYQKKGFTTFQDSKLHLFLPISQIRQLFE